MIRPEWLSATHEERQRLVVMLKAFSDDGTFIIRYEDQDVGDDVFVGENAKASAINTYILRGQQGWNVHLFAKVISNT